MTYPGPLSWPHPPYQLASPPTAQIHIFHKVRRWATLVRPWSIQIFHFAFNLRSTFKEK